MSKILRIAELVATNIRRDTEIHALKLSIKRKDSQIRRLKRRLYANGTR